MKNLSIIILVVVSMVLFGSCQTNDFEENNIEVPEMSIEREIIDFGQEILCDVPYENNRTFSVNVDKGNKYHVDINGTEIILVFENAAGSVAEKLNLSEPNSNTQKKLIKQSRNLVIGYIKNSDVLRDKENLISYIENLPIYISDIPELPNCAALYDLQQDIIFINKSQVNLLCEWTLVHEMIHALCQKTNGGESNLRYPYDIFNEVLTDIITRHIKPKMLDGYIGSYTQYWGYGYEFFGIFDIVGIESYFYGYDLLFDRITPEELDLFVNCINNCNEQLASVAINNCVNSWMQRG